jgi:uncharacterized damage-inducible protein DinB
MDARAYFGMLARYNRVANERLYASCAELSETEYRRERRGSFGSIHALLNHILLGDWIWMERFEGNTGGTPTLDTELFTDLAELRLARIDEDTRIEAFFENLVEDFLARSFRYINHQGQEYVEEAPVAVSHFFNHQTHHRGQVHVMLSQASAPLPSLDLHRIVNP